MSLVKICGLTNYDDAMAALDMGSDYIGFVLYGGSPRGIRSREAVAIAGRLDAPGKLVGVFVNERRAFVEQVAADCGMHAVQLHGDEVAEDFLDMPLPVWRALKWSGVSFVPSPEEWRVDRYVVDAAVAGSYGGTGELADWNRARDLAMRHRVMLSGGLTPENAAEAVRSVRPMGVDASSGLESSPGRKDRGRMKKFIEIVRGVESDEIRR